MQPPEGYRLSPAAASAWLPPTVAPGLFGTAPAQGLGDSELPDRAPPQPHQYRHWERVRRFLQYSQDRTGLTAHPSCTPPHHQQHPSCLAFLILGWPDPHLRHLLHGQAWHPVLTEGTSLPSPSPSHPLQTSIVTVTAPEGKSFLRSSRFFNKDRAT